MHLCSYASVVSVAVAAILRDRNHEKTNEQTNKQTKKTTHRTEILVCRVFVWFGLVLFFVCFFLPRLPSFVVASGKRGGVSGRVRLKMAPEGKRTWQRGSCRRPSLITGRFVVVSLSLSLSLSRLVLFFFGKKKTKIGSTVAVWPYRVLPGSALAVVRFLQVDVVFIDLGPL